MEYYIVLVNGQEHVSFLSYNAARHWCNRAVNTGKAIMA
jgi:hypothetical protein